MLENNSSRKAGQGPNRLAGITEDGTHTAAVGSGFLNSSYSGADIRVVVNLPVNLTALKLEIDKINARIDDADLRQKRAEKVLAEAQFRVDRELRTRLNPKSPTYQTTFGAINTIQEITNQKTSMYERKTKLEELMTKNNRGTLTLTLGTCQTLSWSIFREKTPIRFLGSVYPRAYVRGPRTIAGSMIFTMFDRHAFQDILDWGLSPYSTGHKEADHDYYRDTTMLIDQLPPLDITLMFANEFGSVSYMNLYGVEFQSEGGTFSIEDLFSESVVQYVARDIDPIRDTLKRETDVETNALTEKYKPKTASQLRREEYADHEMAVIKRRNPYI
jgi:hypothetical protein